MSYAQRLQGMMAPPPPIPPATILAVAPPPMPPPPIPSGPPGDPSWQAFEAEAALGIDQALDGEDMAGVLGLVFTAYQPPLIPQHLLGRAHERIEAWDKSDEPTRWFTDGPTPPTHRERFRVRWQTFGLGRSPL